MCGLSVSKEITVHCRYDCSNGITISTSSRICETGNLRGLSHERNLTWVRKRHV